LENGLAGAYKGTSNFTSEVCWQASGKRALMFWQDSDYSLFHVTDLPKLVVPAVFFVLQIVIPY